jgi:hypothetical protein
MLLVVLGMLLLVGAILWASRMGKVKEYGRVLTVFSLVVLIVLTIAMAIKPAEVTVPPEEQPGQFSVLSVEAVSNNVTYATSTRTFTVAMNAAASVVPANFSAIFSVQRTDSGATTDIKTVTASVSQSRLTDPVSGDSYNAILPTNYGDPDCDWTMTIGSATTSATNTLSAQMGLTPYETGSFHVTWLWNDAAFNTQNIAVNDVIYAGSINVGGTVYTVNVLITGI